MACGAWPHRIAGEESAAGGERLVTTYPDSAFATSTQIVLFFVNVLVTTLSYLWGANIILLIFQKKVSFLRKLLYSVISAFLLHLIIVYGIAYLNGIVIHQLEKLYIGVFINVTKIMNPFAYFVLYLLGVHVLKLSKYQSMHIMRLLYVYFVCCYMLLRIAGHFIFPTIPDPRGWNYLRDIWAISSGTAFIYVLYWLVTIFIKRNRLHLELPDNLVIPNSRRELLKNFGVSFVVYGIVMLCLYFPTNTGYEYIYLTVILLCYMAISMLVEYVRVYQNRLGNKDAHIALLNGSIEEFRGIKHDFYNILQTYSGFLDVEAYDGLGQYHRRMIKTMVSSDTKMKISRRMPEHPAFFSLVSAKMESAKAKNIDFQIDLACNMEEIHMDPLDFCRVLAILIDNATEAAEETVTKRVELSAQQKPDDSYLFILSNDTAEAVDAEQIFISGFTTKPKHMGQGLAQVREILQRYGNCTFNITNYQNSFTVYFEIKAKDESTANGGRQKQAQ